MDNGESSYRRFLAGDNEGLHEIICSYRAGLILYLNSFVQNVHTSEELTEDVFLELIIKRPKFSGKCSFKTWLYAIGRNITAKYLRKHKKLKRHYTAEILTDSHHIEFRQQICDLSVHSIIRFYPDMTAQPHIHDLCGIAGKRGSMGISPYKSAAAKKYGMEGNYVAGANIAGFEKVLTAMEAQGVV